MSKKLSSACSPFSKVKRESFASRCRWLGLVALGVIPLLSGCHHRMERLEPHTPSKPTPDDMASEDAAFSSVEPDAVATTAKGSPRLKLSDLSPEEVPTFEELPDAPIAVEVATEKEVEIETEATPMPSFLPVFTADPPELLSRPIPMFHESADLDAIAGSSVRFRIMVDEEGAVVEAELIETTHPGNVAAAREAILQSRYRPVRTPQGMAIRVTLEEALEF